MTTERSDGDAANGAAPTIPSASTPGDLRAQRESLGLTAKDLAHRLRMQARQVEAMERGDWEALPGIAFVRGALRNYGRAIGIDVQPLLDAVGGFAKPTEARSTTALNTPFPATSSTFDFRTRRRSNRAWLLWAIVGVVAVVAIAYFFNTDPQLGRLGGEPQAGAGGTATETIDASGQRVTTVTTPAASPAASVAAPADAGASTAGAASGTPAATSAPLAGADGTAAAAANTTAAATTAATTAATAAPAAPSVPRLVLQFSQDAWVDIRDPATNRILFFGTAKAGSSQSYSDTGPLKLTLGNVNKVSIEVNGKPYDPKAYSKDNVARFTLKD